MTMSITDAVGDGEVSDGGDGDGVAAVEAAGVPDVDVVVTDFFAFGEEDQEQSAVVDSAVFPYLFHVFGNRRK